MNRTITINLSGIVFHIDENAYDKLKQYLEKLKSHFNSIQGNDEIIHDIESRIAEMFSEKISEAKNVITLDEVNSVIEAMGNPEEVAGEEKATTSNQSTQSNSSTNSDTYFTTNKRFFRNTDDKVFGGVCSGIAAYFDFDPVWLRLVFALSFFFAGTGLLLYIILWAIVPAAKTTAEKLQMRGERVNISNIEKNIREEMGGVKETVENFGKKINSDSNRQRIKDGSIKAVSFAGDVFRAFFMVIGKIIGFIITVISIAFLIALTIVVFSLFGIFSFGVPGIFAHMIFSPADSIWLIIGSILLIGIPLVLLLLNGIKILFSFKLNLKKIGFVMLFFWLTGVALATYEGVKLAKEFTKEGTVREQSTLSIYSDTLQLVLSPNKAEWKEMENEFNSFDGGIFIHENEDSIYIRTVCFDIQQSKTDSVELVINRRSRGSSTKEARELANNIDYNYSSTGNSITLSPILMILTSDKFRAQNVNVILKLPVGKSIYLPKDSRMILDDVQNITDTDDYEMVGHTWTMTKDGLECKDFAGDQPNPKKWKHLHKVEVNVN